MAIHRSNGYRRIATNVSSRRSTTRRLFVLGYDLCDRGVSFIAILGKYASLVCRARFGSGLGSIGIPYIDVDVHGKADAQGILFEFLGRYFDADRQALDDLDPVSGRVLR